MTKMKFGHLELLNPKTVEVEPNNWTKLGARRKPVGPYANVERTEVEMTADEAKDYCVKMYRDNRYVQLIHNGLVWCDSWAYALNYEECV